MMTRFASLAAILSLLAGCGGPPPPEPPEGFTIAVDFVSIDVALVDSIRIRFSPPDTTRFEAIEDATFEGGAITLSQEADSSLVFDVTGDHVRAHISPPSGGGLGIYELQVWSDDPMMRTGGPLVTGTAFRSGTAIGSGDVFIPSWPPPIEVEETCTGATCRARLAITCSSSAASMGLCL